MFFIKLQNVIWGGGGGAYMRKAYNQMFTGRQAWSTGGESFKTAVYSTQ